MATVSTYLKAPETFKPKSVSNVTPTMTQMPACLIFFKRIIDRRCSLSEASSDLHTEADLAFLYFHEPALYVKLLRSVLTFIFHFSLFE